MTTQEYMGQRIKSLRESKKLSQSELAKQVGYKDKTAVAKVEAGKVDLPQSKIAAFSKALNTTISYLFSDPEIELVSNLNEKTITCMNLLHRQSQTMRLSMAIMLPL